MLLTIVEPQVLKQVHLYLLRTVINDSGEPATDQKPIITASQYYLILR
jgi:hypothetical protein